MTVELHTDDRPAGFHAEPDGAPLDRHRPNVSGDLPTIFEMAPMFRRALAGYDRFQVDTYVQWAEHQLATAELELERLENRHLQTLAELDEARELLSHSTGGAELLSLSRRVGSLLAAAADEAEGIRADAEAHRCAASAEADRTLRLADRILADAEIEAARLVAAATAEAEEQTDRAGRVVDAAEHSRRAACADAVARQEEARLVERRAAEHAARVRQQAGDDAAAARLQAREEIVRMLAAGRDQRRAADAAAEAARERLDRETTALRAEVRALEERRAVLRAEVAALGEQRTEPATDESAGALARLLARGRSLRVG